MEFPWLDLTTSERQTRGSSATLSVIGKRKALEVREMRAKPLYLNYASG
jgi:hypothetical protein